MENVFLTLDLILLSLSKQHKLNSILLTTQYWNKLVMQLDKIMELFLSIALFQDQLPPLDLPALMLPHKLILPKLSPIVSTIFLLTEVQLEESVLFLHLSLLLEEVPQLQQQLTIQEYKLGLLLLQLLFLLS